jgi:hypothetical protein
METAHSFSDININVTTIQPDGRTENQTRTIDYAQNMILAAIAGTAYIFWVDALYNRHMNDGKSDFSIRGGLD